MKKSILAWNVRLSAIACGFTLFYAGFQIGKYRFGAFFPPSQTGAPFLILALICLFWLFTGNILRKEDRSPAGYCIIPTTMLILNGLLEASILYSYYKGVLFSNSFLTWGTGVFLFSVWMTVSNFICTAITRREQKEAAALPKTE